MTWRTYASQSLALQSFLLTFLLFLVSYCTVGWWVDAYQHMFDTALSGELTNYYLPAAGNPFPEYMPGAGFVLNRLGAMLPIRWVTFFLNGVLFISIWILFKQVLTYSISFPWLSRTIVLLFFALLFFESVVLYHMVRITMFAGIAAVSFLVVNNENALLSKKALPYLLLFIVALWIRCNVHLFILVFITAVFIVHKKPLLPLLPFWVAFILFFAFYCKIVFINDHSKDLNSFFLYNAEFKLYFVGKYVPDLKLTQPLDALKYLAIKNDIVADEENLGVAFYDRIGIFSNLNKFSINQLMYAVNVFVTATLQNIYFIIADLVLIFFYIVLGGNKIRHYKLKTIALFFFFYATVFAICFIKMENRFLVPFQVLFLFTIITLHQPRLFSERRNIYYLLLFVLLLFPISLKYIFKKIDIAKTETKEFKNGFDWLGQNYAKDVLVYNTGFVTKNRPYETFYQRKWFKKFYTYNYYSTQFSPMYRPYLQKECNCNVGPLYPFYDFLTRGGNSALLIDNPKRIEVLQTYLDSVYQKKYSLQHLNSDSLTLKGFRGGNAIFKLSAAEKGL
ncbi:MAG: hypothetical protein KA149_04165 [Chitinophagales bacterium]|nr:hypothetical protein [Chitinophagales bacterium]